MDVEPQRCLLLKNFRNGKDSAKHHTGSVFLSADTLLSDQATDRVHGAQANRDALFASDEDWLSGRGH